jgi:DMSO reductase family type II enzyme chaperone
MNNLSDSAALRSQLYQLLALGFVHPVEEFHQTLSNGSYSLAVTRAANDAHAIDTVLGQPQMSFADYEAEYIRIFQVGKRGQPLVHLNAGDYKELIGSGSRPEFLLEYSGWYRLFGLKTNEEDSANELPDHIVCQLELMAWLAHLEHSTNDNPELQKGYQCAQRDFCERHLQEFLELLIIEYKRAEPKSPICSFFLNLATISLEAVTAMQSQFNKALGASSGHTDNPDIIASVNLWG